MLILSITFLQHDDVWPVIKEVHFTHHPFILACNEVDPSSIIFDSFSFNIHIPSYSLITLISYHLNLNQK